MKLVKDAETAPVGFDSVFATRLDQLTLRLEDVPRQLRRVVDMALSDQDLSRAQWRLLTQVLRYEGMTQTELARSLDLERATVGQALDALEHKKLVKRKTSPGDRRVWLIVPTDKARDILPYLRVAVDEIYEQMFASFNEAEISQLHEFLERIMANLEE